ncbi:MAG: hypothetical protein HW421_3074 [Ignavibacteria bacterium]|nr:hypothetical protein [Ignavibacteria bacterium]
MKKLLVLTATVLLLVIQAYSQNEVRIGIGASFGMNFVISSDGPAGLLNLSQFYVPINFTKNFRCEPFFYYYNSNSAYQTETGSKKIEKDETGIALGTGIFYCFDANKSTVPYLGLKFGYGSNSSSSNASSSDFEDSQSIIMLSGVIGGDYFFSPNFSLGAEVNLNYQSYGEPTEKSGTSEVKFKEYSKAQISTSAMIIARIYF